MTRGNPCARRRGVGLTIARAVTLAWLATAPGCHHATPGEAPLPRLEGVSVARCGSVAMGSLARAAVCQVGTDRALSVFVPAGATDVVITTDRGELTRAATTGSEGRVFAVDVPGGATELVVTARVTEAGGARRARRTPLADMAPPPDWLAEARAQKERGALDDATRTLDAAERDLDAAAPRRADVLSLRARIALARGDGEAAARLLVTTADLHAARGELSQAADDLGARAYVLIGDLRRAGEARGTIARLAAYAEDYPEAGALAPFYEGYLAGEIGDLGGSLALLESARVRAARLGVGKITRAVLQAYTSTLLSVGRADEAHALLTKLDAAEGAEMTPCDHATLELNTGWAALLVRDSPFTLETPPPDPLAPLRRAVDAFAGACPNPRLHASALTNLAWGELQAGNLAAARDALARARALAPHPRPLVAFFALETEGRIAMASGDAAGARRVYDALLAAAAGVSRIDEEAAEEGRAGALRRLGDREGALAAASRAEALLDDAARAIPAGEGRGAFWWARARLLRTKVSLLLDAGRAADALDAARTARARILRDVQHAARVEALDARSRETWQEALAEYRRVRDAIVAEAAVDWSLSADALARRLADRRARDIAARARLDALAAAIFPPAPRALPALAEGDRVVGLAWVPLEEGWAAFVVERGAVRVVRVAAPEAPARASEAAVRLIDAVRGSILRARRLRVLPFGALRDVDLGALDVDGEPLVARVPIEYPLDAAGAKDDAADVRAPSSLVIADPTGALPAARREGLAIAGKRTGAGAGSLASGARLLVGAEATRARVLDELGGATSLHFAGHASYAGVDGWESALFLANGERLTVADVLALPLAPRRVVLSGCETGSEGERGGPVGLGLADAFIAAGARAVIASTRHVDDATTESLMRALSAALEETPDDAAAALQRAELEVRRALPTADWSAFRAFVR